MNKNLINELNENLIQEVSALEKQYNGIQIKIEHTPDADGVELYCDIKSNYSHNTEGVNLIVNITEELNDILRKNDYFISDEFADSTILSPIKGHIIAYKKVESNN